MPKWGRCQSIGFENWLQVLSVTTVPFCALYYKRDAGKFPVLFSYYLRNHWHFCECGVVKHPYIFSGISVMHQLCNFKP